MTKKYQVDDITNDDNETQSYNTLLLVIVSLLFAAVFGGALIGGVLEGGASNGFFFTIISASSIVAIVGIVFGVRYCCRGRKDVNSLEIKEGKGTFNSDEEEGKVVVQKANKKSKLPPKIKEVDPAVGVSDVSVLSLNTYGDYDVESVMTDGDQTGITSFAGRILLNKSRQRKPGFDFANVVPDPETNFRGRVDPPEASDTTTPFAFVEQTRQMGPRDPSAARIKTPSSKGRRQLQVIDVDEEESPTNKFATTPASIASGIFRGFFANVKRKTAAATPVVANGQAAFGRPPMPGSTRNAKADKQPLQTINGGLTKENLPSTPKGLSTVPLSPGKSSVFSIPPPRRVPSSPGGVSEAAKSAFSDGAASSTFDPAAHERALAKMRGNTAALGATGNDVPIYDDDDDGESTGDDIYDVFAPAGPIGLVVDSTPKGCVVHSLRKTSSMQGLINPGDLIIALDDEDVTKMDASELTKLMARKAQQTERKFTLITAQ